MNDATANIIDFLNRYELDLGAEASDGEMVGDPDALQAYVSRLLVQPPVWVSSDYAQKLRDSILEADWSEVAEEQKRRILAADSLQAGSENQGVPHSAGNTVA